MNRYLTGMYALADRGGVSSAALLRKRRPMTAGMAQTILGACIGALEERAQDGDAPSQEAVRQLANMSAALSSRNVDVLPDTAADVIDRAADAVDDCLGAADGGSIDDEDPATEEEPLLMDYGIEMRARTQVLDDDGEFTFPDAADEGSFQVLGARERSTLGPRGRNTIIGVAVLEWDNHNTYQPGEIVYFEQKHWRALRTVTPPFLPVFMKGDVPGSSDAWREISAGDVYGGNVIGAGDDPDMPVLNFSDAGPAPDDYGTMQPDFGDDVLGEVDVDALAERFDSLPSTNRTVWSMWVDSAHGAGLLQRVTAAAQKMLNQAIVPTTEFSFHDSVMAFADRFKKLDTKVVAQPIDDNQSPVWSEVKSYFVDGGKLANLLEGTAAQTLKWSDVKDAAREAAHGAGKALDDAKNTAKWTTGLLVGGAVLLGAGALYAVYKIASGPTGGAIVGSYLGRR